MNVIDAIAQELEEDSQTAEELGKSIYRPPAEIRNALAVMYFSLRSVACDLTGRYHLLSMQHRAVPSNGHIPHDDMTRAVCFDGSKDVLTWVA